MEDIRLYDFEFNLLHIEHDIISSNWTINYNDVGTWESAFNLNSDIIPIALNNPYLVIVQGDKQAIITGKQATAEGKLYGRTVNWILSKRVIHKFNTHDMTINKDVESISRWVIAESFSDVDNFVLGEVVGFVNTKEFWRNTTNPVNEVVKDCLANDSAGHKVIFDTKNKKWIFQVIKGETLPLIISDDNRNAFETTYTEDSQDYFTGGWYEQEQPEVEGVRPDPIWQRIESDTIKTGIYKWDCVLNGTVESEAKSELAKKKWKKSIKTKTRDLKYGVNYNLGDKVKVQKQAGQWQKTHDTRIIGVNIWYENNNIGEQPIFEEMSE